MPESPKQKNRNPLGNTATKKFSGEQKHGLASLPERWSTESIEADEIRVRNKSMIKIQIPVEERAMQTDDMM